MSVSVLGPRPFVRPSDEEEEENWELCLSASSFDGRKFIRENEMRWPYLSPNPLHQWVLVERILPPGVVDGVPLNTQVNRPLLGYLLRSHP